MMFRGTQPLIALHTWFADPVGIPSWEANTLPDLEQ